MHWHDGFRLWRDGGFDLGDVDAEVGIGVDDDALAAGHRHEVGVHHEVWVEDHDLNIVKSYGKVAYQEKKGSDQQFPHFETYRENIEGKFWFPTYTRANDVLHFKTSDVPIHMVVRYEKYKRFGSTIKIGAVTEVPDQPEKKPQKPPQR